MFDTPAIIRLASSLASAGLLVPVAPALADPGNIDLRVLVVTQTDGVLGPPQAPDRYVSLGLPIINEGGKVVFEAFVRQVGGSQRRGLFWADENGSRTILIENAFPLYDDVVTFGTLLRSVTTRERVVSQVELSGPGVSTQTNQAIVLYDFFRSTPLMRKGDAAPGFAVGSTITAFGDPLVNETGRVFISARVRGPESSTDQFAVYECGDVPMHLLARSGVSGLGALDANGISESVSAIGVARQGDVIVTQSVRPPGANSRNSVVLRQLGDWAYLGRAGDALPNLDGATGAVIAMHLATMDRQQHVLATGSLSPEIAGNRYGVWVVDQGVSSITLAEDSNAPGFSPGVFCDHLVVPQFNRHGHFIIVSTVRGLRPTGTNWVCYLQDGDGLRSVIQEYTQAPGLDEIRTMRDFRRWGFNDLGQISVVADISNSGLTTRPVLYLRNPDGEMWPIVKAGDWIEVVPGDWKQIQNIYPSESEGLEDAPALSHSGEIAFRLDFNDESQAIVVARVPIEHGACCRGATCTITAPWDCSRFDSPRAVFAGPSTACNPPGQYTSPCCRADFNASGSVTVEDLFLFLAAYFSGSDLADADASGTLSVQDVLEFVGAFFADCSG